MPAITENMRNVMRNIDAGRVRISKSRTNREFAVHYGVTGTGSTMLDQCTAVLRAAIQQSKS